MQDQETIVTGARASKMKKLGLFAGLLLLAAMLGFIPMWLQERAVSAELATTQKQLSRAEIKNLLTTAIVESRRGEYETARQSTSDFYTRLRAEIDKADGGTYTADERGKLNAVFNDRDTMITLLAQRDPAASEKLTQMYVTYQTSVGQPPVTTASPAATTPTVTQ
jgi:hypothetical protein